jgi:hypothetical protein
MVLAKRYLFCDVQDDSLENRENNATTATVFFAPFPTFRVGAAPAIADKAVPSLFSRLDSMVPTKKHVTPGHYLFAVYGDNFIGRSSYSYLLAKGITDPAKVHSQSKDSFPFVLTLAL